MRELFTARRLWLAMCACAVIFGLTNACDSGDSGGGLAGGCDCMAPIPGGFDEKYNIDGLVQLRMTDHAMKFLEGKLVPIVGSFMGEDGLEFQVPETEIDEQNIGLGIKFKDGVVCRNPKPGECVLGVDLCNISITTQEPNHLIVNTLLGIHGQCQADFCAGQNCPDAIIKLQGTVKTLWDNKITCTAKMNIRNKMAGIPVAFKTEQATRRTYFEVGDVALNFSDKDYDIKCDGNNLGGDILSFLFGMLQGLIKGTITDMLNKEIKKMVDDLMGDFTCQKCDKDPNVCSAGTKCVDKECRNSANKCVPPPLGVEGQLDAGSILADFAPGLEANVKMKAVLGGGSADVMQNPYISNNGLMLGMMGGADSDKAECVPITERPPFVPPPEAPFRRLNDFDRGKVDAQGNPVTIFHVGIGVSDLMLDHFFWNAFNSGVLCLQLDGGSIEQLSSGLFSLLLPSLKYLTQGDSRPVMLKMIPTKPPLIDIGRGRFDTKTESDGTTTYAFKEPLLNIAVPDLSIDFYVFAFDRWVRLFTMTVDLKIGMALAFHTTEDGTIQAIPLLSDLNNAFQNVRITNNEIIAEPPEKLKDIIPTLLDIALPMLTDALAEPFDLAGPDTLQGFILNLAPEDVSGVMLKDPMPQDCEAWIDENGNRVPACHQFLGIFAELGFDPDAAKTTNMPRPFIARVSPLVIPTSEDIAKARQEGRFVSPHIVIETGAYAERDGELEFAYRVDEGAWSPFMAGEKFRVTSPRLWLLGKHRIEVVSRFKNELYTMSRTPAVYEFIVDPTPPTVSLRLDYEGQLLIIARDDITPRENLVYSISVNGAPFSAYSEQNVYDLSRHINDGNGVWLRVRAKDENGNVGEAELGGPFEFSLGNAYPVRAPGVVESIDPEKLSGFGETQKSTGCIAW